MNCEVEKIRKEIERRKKEYCNGLDAVTELYDSLLSFIDSLQEEKNRFNIGDIVRNEITDDTYTIVEILEDKYRAVLNGYSKSPIYVIPLNQGGWELVSPSSSTIGLRTKEENSFDSHIQEGDKITVNENGSRFNRSQLERVIAKHEEPVSEKLEEAAFNEFPNDNPQLLAPDAHYISNGEALRWAYKKGAEWREKQLMENPLLYGWVARDGNGSLHIFEVEPLRISNSRQWWDRDYQSTCLDSRDFPDLKWEDEPVYVKIVIIKE